MAALVKPHTLYPSLTKACHLVKRYALLVPEAVLLTLVFGIYLVMGRPLGLAVLGLTIVLMFGVRVGALWLGWRAWQRGRYVQAARRTHLGYVLNPWSADAVTLMALVAVAQGDYDGGARYWSRAQALFPRPLVHTGLGTALAASGHWRAARWQALQALALDDTQAAAYALLAESTLRLNDAPQMILELTQIGLSRSNDAATQAALYLTRAEAAFAANQRSLANAAIDQALGLLFYCPAPTQAEYVFRLGQLRRRLGDTATAIHDFERIPMIDPEGRWVAPAWRARQETLLRAA